DTAVSIRSPGVSQLRETAPASHGCNPSELPASQDRAGPILCPGVSQLRETAASQSHVNRKGIRSVRAMGNTLAIGHPACPSLPSRDTELVQNRCSLLLSSALIALCPKRHVFLNRLLFNRLRKPGCMIYMCSTSDN